MTTERIKEIPESKKKIVAELIDLIKNKNTIMITSIKNIPASQFQEIGKKLRGKAIVKVPKKNLIFRALDAGDNEEVKKLKDQIKDSVAILFSEMDSFELAAELLANTSPAKAKAGQEAHEDIKVEAGPTDLLPGPAISELGAVGIQVQIEKGKIHIKESKVIAKKGEKISANAADIMGKLDIKPFRVGFIPISAFDNKDGKLYLEIKVDQEGTVKELKALYGKSLALAVEIGYFSQDTIKFLIGKAGSHEKALGNLSHKEEPKEKEEEKKEEVKEKPEEPTEKTEEEKPKEETNDQTQTHKPEEENK